MDIDILLKIIEIIGLLTGIIYVIGAILEKKWCWYFGIIATIAYAISTYYFKLYGEFILQFFYLSISIYGISQWSEKEIDDLSIDVRIDNNKLQIKFSTISFLLKMFIVGSFLSAVIYWGLIYLESTYPFWDSITSGFGVIATYMTVKKKIDNWIIWIIIDIILSYILYLKGLPYYSFLYLIYLIFAVVGFYKWKKEIKIQ